MKTIQVLGPGCVRCKKLAENTELAINDLGLDWVVEKVEDVNEIMKFKIWATPALVVDGVVKSTGRVLSMEEIKKMIA